MRMVEMLTNTQYFRDLSPKKFLLCSDTAASSGDDHVFSGTYRYVVMLDVIKKPIYNKKNASDVAV